MQDFNFPNICWSGLYPVLDPFPSAGQGFLNLCTCFNFTKVVKQPTRCTGTCSNTLDLILSTHPELVTCLSYLPGLSDHYMLQFFLDVTIPRCVDTIKKIRDYSKADFKTINQKMYSYFDAYLTEFEQLSVQNWDRLQNKVNELTDAHVPRKFIPGSTLV